jgi:hypothetical protein
MATSTYTPIATTTLVSAASSYTFSSIPQTYTDLVIVINGFTSFSSSADAYQVSFNGGSTGLSITRLYGNGSSASSDRYSTPYAGWISTTRGADVINIMNYSNTTTYKTAITRSSSQGSYPIAGATALLWQSTNAITSVTISDTSGNWQIGTTFSLYGISAAPAVKATGGMITSDSTYYYHTFTSTGTFTPTQSLSADILVVAGGGGGAASGAGAGGLLAYTSQSLTATGYTCTVGAGGAGGANGQLNNGSNGANSQFGSLTAAVGGGGSTSTTGATNSLSGYSGGSGSGAFSGGGGSDSGSKTGGSPTSGQGYAGGNSFYQASSSSSGGGGGAGAAGANATAANTGGVGGAGVNTYSSWATATGTGVSGYYSGGGGGGIYVNGTAISGGAGGGGTGSTNNAVGSSGTANTGGGAGGYYSETYKTAVYNGGSGIVIVRYAK